MESIAYLYQSTNFLDVTLTDEAGSPVTGATVTATIVPDKGGTAVVTGVAMEDQGAGVYRYVAPADLAVVLDGFYRVQITAVSGAFTRYAEPVLHVKVDRD